MRYVRNQRRSSPPMVRDVVRRSTPRVAGVIPFGDATEDLLGGESSLSPEPERLVEAVSVIDVVPVARSRRGERVELLDHGQDLTGLRDDDHDLYYHLDGIRALSGDMPLGTAVRNFTYSGNNAVQIQANAGATQYLVLQTSSAGFASRLTCEGNLANQDLKIAPKGTGNVIITNLEFAGVAPSFTGAQHDHEDAAGGGTLDHTAALTNVGTNTHAQLDSLAKFFQGTFLESFNALVIEDGGAVKMTLEKAGTGDLTMVFSDGHTTLDCTPILSIPLTEGVDAANPQKNYVYVLQSAKILALSTTGWPDTEHIKVGFFLIQTDIEVAARGALINQNWNDHAADTSGTDIGQGHLTHITERTRRLGAIWLNGCEGVATQDGNDLWVSIASGIVSQLHPHTFSALDSDTAGASDPILVVNDPDAAYTIVNSLNEITKNANGVAIGNNKFVKFVLVAVANKSGELSPMMLNLPTDEYNTASAAATDVQGYANFAIPAEFGLESTTGFLIAAFVCKHTATAMQIQSTIDQRGNTPSTATGAGTGGGDVTAAAVLTDNAVIRGDGGAKGVQDSGVLISDTDEMSGLTRLTVDFLQLNAGVISTTSSDADLTLDADGAGNIRILDDLDCSGNDIKDNTRAYVVINDQLKVEGVVGLGTNPVFFAQLIANPSGSNIYFGIYGGVVYTGTNASAYGMLFIAEHGKTDPGNHQWAYGAWITAENKGTAAATKIMRSTGGFFQAVNSGNQSQATASAYAYSAWIKTAKAGTGANGAGNFYGCSLYVEDATVPVGTTTTNLEWAAQFAGDVQIFDDKKLILEGSATTKGDTYFVYDSANVTLDVFVGGVEKMNIGSSAFTIIDKLILPEGMQTKYSTDDVADPPTDAELDTAFGDPTVVGSGFIGVLDDNDAGTDCYICWTTGTAGEWFYVKGTKAA